MKQMTVLSQQQIEKKSTKELRDELAQSLEFTAKHLVYMGLLWKELEDRGEDLSALKKGISVYIPMIAYGRLDAQLVINYAGQKTLLSAIAQLPLESQKKILKDGKVELFNKDTQKPETVDLIDIKASYIPQVFSEKGIRSIEAQQEILKHTYVGKSYGRKPRKARKAYIDSKESLLYVTANYYVPLSDVHSLLVQQYGENYSDVIKGNDE